MGGKMNDHNRYHWLLLVLFFMTALSSCGVQGSGQPVQFQTLAQGGVLGSYREVDTPEIQIIAGAQDIDNLIPYLPGNPPRASDNADLVSQLRQLDYTHFFAVLITQGQKEPRGFKVMVQQITRQDDRITVQAQFIGSGPGEGQPMVSPDPYHLVAVTKDGAWGRQMQFALVADGKVVAETMHFIP
jgi:hypothetical protein